MRTREAEILPGWPAGLEPTYENILRMVTREHPTRPLKQRETIARETLAMFSCEPAAPISPTEVEEEAEMFSPSVPGAVGLIRIAAIPDDAGAVRLTYERVVPRSRAHQEAFSVAAAFLEAARKADQPFSLRAGGAR